MPVSTNTSKLRARSLGNGTSEMKPHSPEEAVIEMSAMRKELLQAREETSMLKCRMKKMEEEHNKKIKLLERNLAAARKESTDHEKKRESSAESVSVLKQKCQKLELALKEQDLAMKKLQHSRPTRPTELKGLVTAYSPNNNASKKSTTDSKDSGRSSAGGGSGQTSGPSHSVMNEISRLKEAIRKLQTENNRLQQQLKERNEEIKLLKQQAVRARTTKPNISGSSSAPSALGRRSGPPISPRTSANSSDTKNIAATGTPQRQSVATTSRTAVHQSSPGTSSSMTTTTTRVSKVTKTIDGSSNRILQGSPPKKSPSVIAKNKVAGAKPGVPKAAGRKEVEKGASSLVTSPKAKLQMNGSLSVTKNNTTPGVLDSQVVEMQQNVAAKKIQRSWRNHYQKKMNESATEELQMEQDVELLQSVLRGHQERLEHVAMQDDYGSAPESDLKEALSVVQAAHKNIWNLNAPQEE